MGYADNIHKIERGNLVDNVVAQITELINIGVWKEGEKIASESQLAKDFSVSRVVIREALQNLRSRNIIVTRHGLGSFVCNSNNFSNISGNNDFLALSEEDLLSLYELRTCVENRAIQLSTVYGTEEDFEQIRKALDQMKVSTNDLLQFTEADLAFHMAIVKSGHSRLLIKAYQSCEKELFTILKEMNRIYDSHTFAISSHTDIYQAISARDAKRALTVLKNAGDFNKVRYYTLFKL